MLTLEKSKQLISTTTTQPHLLTHATAVMAAMGGMAAHFGEDVRHWQAVGYLHDYDYEQYPEEHLDHTAEPLRAEGVTEEEIRLAESVVFFCFFRKINKNIEKSKKIQQNFKKLT